MAKANDNVRYVSKKDVKGKNVTKKVYKVDPTKPHQQRSSGNYVSSNNSAQDYYFHQARRNPHQYLVNYKPVKTGREYYAEQARKNPHEYLTNYEIQPYQPREEWMAENRNQHTEKRGLLSRIFGTMGYNGIVEGLYNATDNDDSTTFGQGLIEGAKNMAPWENDVSGYNTFSDVLRNMGWEDNPDGSPNIARGVVGFLGDVLLDPMTYFNPFSSAGKIAKGTGVTLDMAKELKAFSKAASVSDELGKAGRAGHAGSKLRDLPYKQVRDYVAEKNPHLSPEEIEVKATRLHDSYARKVQGVRNVDEGADFGFGFAGLPFSSKIKVGDKTLDKFHKNFVKASSLREFGDNTIAPYYNSMMKKLRSTRAAGLVSKNNQMLRTAQKSGVFDSFKEFYLRDTMKGYDKAARNMKALDTAEMLKKLVDNFDDTDVAQFVDDYEKGLYVEKIKFEKARLNAELKSIETLELNEAKRTEIQKMINERLNKVSELEKTLKDLKDYLDSDAGKWEYNYATGMVEHQTWKLSEALKDFYNKQINEAEQTFAKSEMNVAESELDKSLDELYDVRQKAEPKIAEAEDIKNTTFESTLTPDELARYNTRDVSLQTATERYEKAKNSTPNDTTVEFIETLNKRNEVLERREDAANALEKTQKEALNMLEEDGYVKITEDGFKRTAEVNQPTSVYENVTKLDLDELHNDGYSFYDFEQRPTAQTIKYFNQFTEMLPEDKDIIAKQWANLPVKTRESKMYPKGEATFENTPWWRIKENGDVDTNSIGIKWSTVYENGKPTKKYEPIGLSPETGYKYIKIADKRQVVNKINQLMKPLGVKFSVYAMTDDIFMDVYAGLCAGNYVDVFSDLREVMRRQTVMIENSKWLNEGDSVVSKYWRRALDITESNLDEKKIKSYQRTIADELVASGTSEYTDAEKEAIEIINQIMEDIAVKAYAGDIDKTFFKELKEDPLLILDSYDARLANRTKHYTRQNLRDWKYDELDEFAGRYMLKDVDVKPKNLDTEVANLQKEFKAGNINEDEYYEKLDALKKTYSSSGKRTTDTRVASVYEDSNFENLQERNYNPFEDNEVGTMYAQNKQWFEDHAQQCYEMYGVSPMNLTNDQAREFLDVVELLDQHLDDTGKVKWNEIFSFARQYEKGVRYKEIDDAVKRLMAGEGIIKNYGKGFTPPHSYTQLSASSNLWYSDVLKNFADEYNIPIEDAIKMFDGGDFEGLTSAAYHSRYNAVNDPVLALKEKLNSEGYSVDSFKKDFLDMDHYEKVALLYAFGDSKTEEALARTGDIFVDTLQDIMREEAGDSQNLLKSRREEYQKHNADIAKTLDNDRFERAVDVIKQYNWKHNKGRVIYDRPLDGLTDYEKHVYGIYYSKEFKRIVDTLPRSDAETLNDVAQKFWKRKMFDEEVALKRKTFDMYNNEWKRNTLVNNVRDSFEYMKKKAGFTGDLAKDEAKRSRMIRNYARAKSMSPIDRKLETILVWERENEVYKYIYQNAGHSSSRRDIEELQNITNEISNAIGGYREKLNIELKKGKKGNPDSRELNLAMSGIRALVNRHSILSKQIKLQPLLVPEQKRIAEKMFVDMTKANNRSKALLGLELHARNVDEENFYKMLDDYFEGTGTKLEERTAEYDRLAEVGESQRNAVEKYDRWIGELDEKAETLKEESKLNDMMLRLAGEEPSDDVKLAALHLNNETEFYNKIEERAAQHERQIKNARRRENRWRNKLDNVLNDVEAKKIAYNEAKRIVDELVVEGASIRTVTQDELKYIQQRLRKFVDDVEKFDTMKERANGGILSDIIDINEEVASLQNQLGDLALADMTATVTDRDVARSIGISDDVLKQISRLTDDDQIQAASILAREMSETQREEFLMGFLTEEQAKAYNKGQSYFRHELTEEGKAFLELPEIQKELGKFNSEYGPRGKFNKHRKFNTRKDAQEWAEKKGFTGQLFEVDPVKVFLVRKIKSNELIHSKQVNDAIKGFCTPYEGKKTSDHIVASYIDVYSELQKGFYELEDEALRSGAEFTQTFDEYLATALKDAGIDDKMFSANYAYFDILPEQMDMLKRSFSTKGKAKNFMLNMNNNIFHDVNQFTKLQMDSMKSGFMKVFDKFQNGWKIANTYINPGFHLQNAMSNGFATFMAIGEDALNPVKLKRTKTIFRTRDPKQFIKSDAYGKLTYRQIADAAEQFGVVDNTFFNKDIADHMDSTIKNPIIGFGNKVGAEIEGFQRLHLFVSALEQGKTFEEAAETVDKFLFDYADLTHFEKTVMKRIIPFYTFMRKNLPLQLEQMIEQPQKYLNIQKAFREIGEMSPDGQYVEENERNPYRQGDIQLPFQINGRSYGVADQLPYTQLERILDPQKLLGQTTPWLKTPVEALTNTFLYTGQSVTGDDGQIQGSDIINYLAQQVPYAKMFENGSKKTGKDNDVVDAETDAATRKKLYVLGQLLGFPINSIDRMYWYDDYGNWARDYFDTPLPQQIRRNMDERKNN